MADSFADYCAAVCALVRFKPDREAIAGELTAHMEDHMAALEAEGAPREEAKARAIEAMGDPEALGKALDALHSPLLGWLQLWMWRLSRLAAVISISLSLLLAVGPVRSGWAGLWDVFDREEVLAVVEKAILLFRDQGSAGERFADTIARLGFENVQAQLLGNELLARREEILAKE